VKASGTPNPASAFTWTGFYAGAHGGYGWGRNAIFDTAVTEHFRPTGGFGGVQAGYNSQFAPHWLLGAEIDVSFGNIRDSLVQGTPFGTIDPGRNKISAFGTARARFGYVQDRVLVYATGGVMWMNDKYAATVPSSWAAEFATVSQQHFHWVWGGGIEYAVDPRWSFKLEYLRAVFGETYGVFPNNFVGPRASNASLSIVRAGVNYRFGAGVSSAGATESAQPNWSGGYVGLHGSYGRVRLDRPMISNGNHFSGDQDAEGGLGGLQGGYNWLFAPRWLLGLEFDSSFGRLKGDEPFVAGGTLVPATGKVDALGTARFRLGYLVTPAALFYATGGVGYGREEYTSTVEATKADHVGWVAGGGVEYKFAPDWSAKLEYRYADLGRYRDDTPAAAPNNYTKTSRLTLNTVMVGLNYSGPVLERLFGAR
jgi:outer membrane immunogenic protein